MIEIKAGEPQPVDCHVCKSSMGYQISEKTAIMYTRRFEFDGGFLDGFYGDSSKVIRQYTRPECIECLATLKFKITE